MLSPPSEAGLAAPVAKATGGKGRCSVEHGTGGTHIGNSNLANGRVDGHHSYAMDAAVRRNLESRRRRPRRMHRGPTGGPQE